MTQSAAQQLKDDAYVAESLLVALFWQFPEYYTHYNDEKINSTHFLNPIWAFYFHLGRQLANKGLVVFDDIATYRMVVDVAQGEKYKEYNGYATIKELMQEVEGSRSNFDSYMEEVKKYSVLKALFRKFGEVIVRDKTNVKYDYKAMTVEQIHAYWMDGVNQPFKDVDNKHDVKSLLKGLKERIRSWSNQPKIGLPFFQSNGMTGISVGWDFGQVYLNGFHSGRGKTSITVAKVLMSCIEHNEKLLVIANEQDIDEFAQSLIVTIAGCVTKKYINRQRFLKGDFTADELARMDEAADWVEKHTRDDGLIQFIFMDSYTIDNVKKILIHYASRGYRSVIIDTGKPGDNMGGMKRWERFALDMTELYKIVRSSGGGLNLRAWVNVQLADDAVGLRFLDETALGDSKKIKNECSVVFLGRPIWEDEYQGGANAVKCYRQVSNELGDGTLEKEEFYMVPYYTDDNGKEWKNNYFFLFTSKNRRGQSNDTGLDVLVFNVNFNSNHWAEVGWAKIPKYSYGSKRNAK